MYKISCKSVHWGLLGKGVKYNESFSMVFIYLFLSTDLQVRPVGGFSRTGSNDAVSRKGVPF